MFFLLKKYFSSLIKIVLYAQSVCQIAINIITHCKHGNVPNRTRTLVYTSYTNICNRLLPNDFFFNTIFVSSHMHPENPEGTQVIVGSMNMGYISDTARNQTHNLFRPKRELIPLGHSDQLIINVSDLIYTSLLIATGTQTIYFVYMCYFITMKLN